MGAVMSSINPKNQEDTILSKLLSNRNQLCQDTIPTELRNEFVQEIFPDNVLRGYAQALHYKHVFGASLLADFIAEYMSLSMSKKRFGRRLVLSGVDPKAVLSKLIQGV